MYFKQKKEREKERLREIKEKVKFDITEQPNPIKVDINTFEGLQKEFKKMSKKKNPLGFGVGERFEKTEAEKW